MSCHEYIIPSTSFINHKLININSPNADGSGGDKLVPAHHPEMMIDAMLGNSGKVISFSMNSGATHVTDWWNREMSLEVVSGFLSRTGLSQSLF